MSAGPYPHHMPGPTPETSTKAIVSLVLGLMAFLTCITGIPAAILGFSALSDINRQPRTGGRGMAIAGIVTGICGMFLPGIAILLALLLPAVQAARDAATRTQSLNQMKMITLGFHMYESTSRRLPDDITSDDGKPLLSWRVRLLPQLEESGLYSQFKLNEPWDSPHNLALVQKMPSVFQCPNGNLKPGTTVYLAPKGKEMILGGMIDGKPVQGMSLSGILDGTSNTILLLEADPDQAVPWTKPADLDVDLKDPLRGLGHLRRGGFLAGFADASTRFISNNVDKELIANCFTPDGRTWGQRDIGFPY